MDSSSEHYCVVCSNKILYPGKQFSNPQKKSHIYVCNTCLTKNEFICCECIITNLNDLVYCANKTNLIPIKRFMCNGCYKKHFCICEKLNYPRYKSCNKCKNMCHILKEVYINRPYACAPIKFLVCCNCEIEILQKPIPKNHHTQNHDMCIAGHDICPDHYITEKCHNINHMALGMDCKIHKLENVTIQSKCNFCSPFTIKLCCRCVEFMKGVNVQIILGIDFPKVLIDIIKSYMYDNTIFPVLAKRNDIHMEQCSKCLIHACPDHSIKLLDHKCN
ncbi:MAG: hypothetical protein Edafosvirus2_81 [Edafosvirus sp.]|uniref:Uncharacterized protein n=1 Tax=Edafosvirus sp. TaxID=2487765 RepID=A0A3G4ZSK9_9VIRU|nr:MAG: hypothetical protein Edafosvirus2_81 [Edafosvirus sp.]